MFMDRNLGPGMSFGADRQPWLGRMHSPWGQMPGLGGLAQGQGQWGQPPHQMQPLQGLGGLASLAGLWRYPR